MIGANSCGVHSVHSAFHGPGPRTSDNVHELTVLTYGGRRLRLGPDGAGLSEDLAAPLRALADRCGDLVREGFPDIPRRVSGYNLDELLPERGFNGARALAGTEGTCVTVLEATVHLVDSPSCRSLLVAGYEDAATAADHVLEVLEHEPLGLEGVDDTLIRDMTLLGQHREDLSLLPDGRGWLLIETGGETKDEADDRAREIMRTLERRRRAARPEALRRRPQRAARLGGSRGRPRRHRLRARPLRHLRGLGGLGRPARAARRLPARAREAGHALRVRERALRPLRPGLR
jgi:FAD/FMN-containing dehydrogenase